jgi:hypothetical protein
MDKIWLAKMRSDCNEDYSSDEKLSPSVGFYLKCVPEMISFEGAFPCERS